MYLLSIIAVLHLTHTLHMPAHSMHSQEAAQARDSVRSLQHTDDAKSEQTDCISSQGPQVQERCMKVFLRHKGNVLP